MCFICYSASVEVTVEDIKNDYHFSNTYDRLKGRAFSGVNYDEFGVGASYVISGTSEVCDENYECTESFSSRYTMNGVRDSKMVVTNKQQEITVVKILEYKAGTANTQKFFQDLTLLGSSDYWYSCNGWSNYGDLYYECEAFKNAINVEAKWIEMRLSCCSICSQVPYSYRSCSFVGYAPGSKKMGWTGKVVEGECYEYFGMRVKNITSGEVVDKLFKKVCGQYEEMKFNNGKIVMPINAVQDKIVGGDYCVVLEDFNGWTENIKTNCYANSGTRTGFNSYYAQCIGSVPSESEKKFCETYWPLGDVHWTLIDSGRAAVWNHDVFDWDSWDKLTVMPKAADVYDLGLFTFYVDIDSTRIPVGKYLYVIDDDRNVDVILEGSLKYSKKTEALCVKVISSEVVDVGREGDVEEYIIKEYNIENKCSSGMLSVFNRGDGVLMDIYILSEVSSEAYKKRVRWRCEKKESVIIEEINNWKNEKIYSDTKKVTCREREFVDLTPPNSGGGSQGDANLDGLIQKAKSNMWLLIGVGCGILVVIVIIYWCCTRKKKKEKKEE